MIRKYLAISALFVLGLMVSNSSHSALQIEITGGSESGLPIAVVPFGGAMPVAIENIIAADLARSGRFLPMARSDMPERPTQVEEVSLSSWRGVEMDYLVIGRGQPVADGWRIEFHLIDVNSGEELIGHAVTARERDLRAAAHRIADLVFEKITGIRGAFSTRIAYVTEYRLDDGERRYALEVADADGYGPQTVLESSQPIMTPTWSPDGRQLAYVSFEGRRSSIWVQNLQTGERYRLTDFPGINGAPAWSPCGDKLAITLSKDGNPEIYIVDLITRQLSRLTKNSAIDTEAAWMPDGRSLVFTSNRSGQAQIYHQRIDESSARRLSFDSPYMAGPAVSPDGEYLAGVVAVSGGFYVGLQNLSTGVLRIISTQGQEERPSFSPNGVMLIYATREQGRSVLRVSPVVGEGHQTLRLERGLVRDPAWGPFH